MAKAWKKTERPVYGDARTELTAPVREIVVLDDPEEVKSTVSPEPADWTTVDKRNWGVVSEITTYDTPSDNVGGATEEKPNSKTEEKTNEKTNEKSEETPKWTPIDEWLVDPVPWSPEDKSKQQSKKWWETAGTTVPQNNQSNTKSWGGTSASNDDWTIKVWEQNANLNYYQYWDDSNPAQQWQKGWMNPKYTGEWVSNSYIEYNPDLTVADLDPNYLYWEAARQQNSKEAGYIARRNDNIASALYNEWLTSREDVANFLSQQKEWMNSTEADRENTIESIYKRLGQMKPQEEKPDLSKADTLVTDTSNTLYGKTTADEWNPKSWIETKVDANSVLNTMEQRRSSELKNFVSTDIQSIASCVVNWTTYWDEQTWRDAQELYPDFIAAVNAEIKKQRGQQNVTAIANGWEMSTNTDWQSNINNSIAWFWASNATSTKSSVEIAKDVHDSLAKNQTANEASATMEWIEEDMAILKNRLKNLRQEANAAFKWDVPDYLVNAYINNKTQEIQNQMSILEDRYNAAYNRYKQEVANTQWEKEYQLKEKQLELAEKEYKLKEWQVKNWVTEKKDTTSSNARYNQWDKWEVTKMSDEEVAAKVDILMDMYESHQLWDAQCGVWIQTYYLPMLWISLNGISTMEQKKSLINEWAWYVPKKWDLIILKGSDPKYWHIWIVTSTDDFWDWSISYIDWNWTLWEDWKWNGKPVARNIMPDDAKIIWFRNINKKDPRVTDTEWTEQDYTNFTNFLDTNNKNISNTDRDSIAEMYWFKDDLVWMREFATDALNNRKEEEKIEDWIDYSDEFWYDPELWYNIYDTKLYQRYYAWWANNSAEDLAAGSWIDVDEFILRARRWKAWNTQKWEETISEWLDWNQKAILQQIVSWDIKLNSANSKTYAEMLWFWWDVELLWKAVTEWIELEGKKQIDNALIALAELQLAFEEYWNIKSDWNFDTYMLMGRGRWSVAWRKFDQVKAALQLDKVVSAREQWVTFGSMTEYEWKQMEKAVSALSIAWMNDEEFTQEYKWLVSKLWRATYWWDTWPTTEEWNQYVKDVKDLRGFDIQKMEWDVKNNPPTTGTTNTPNVPNVPSNQSKSMTWSTAWTWTNNIITWSTVWTWTNNVITWSTVWTWRQSSKDW